MSSARTPIETFEEEERRARMRLAAYRAKLYDHDGASPILVERRLRELERRWSGAADRLRDARHSRRR